MVELTLKVITGSSELEEWTAAIKSGDRWKISEQLQVPRDLLQKAKARGEQLAVRLEPIVSGLADRLLLDDPQDIKGANKLLDDFLQWVDEIFGQEAFVDIATSWFRDRSNDSVTPVSGDARSSFTRAHNTFMQQQKDERSIFGVIMTTSYFLGDIDPGDPEPVRTVKRVALNFYRKVGDRTGNTALAKTEQYMEEFLQTIKPVFPTSVKDCSKRSPCLQHAAVSEQRELTSDCLVTGTV